MCLQKLFFCKMCVYGVSYKKMVYIYINIYIARIDIHRMSKSMSTGLSEDIYHIMTYQIIYQTTCSNICQIECQKICHINCHHHNTCQVECEPSNMSECMSDR